MKKLFCAIAMLSVMISAVSCGGEPELSSSAPPSSSSSSPEISESEPELSEDEYKSSCMVIDYDNFNLLTDEPEKYENTNICYSGYISAVELLSDQKRYGMFVDIVDNMIQTSDTNYIFNTKTMYVQCDIDAPAREPSKWDDVTVYGTFLGTKTQNEKVYPLVVCKYVDIKEKEKTTEPPTETSTEESKEYIEINPLNCNLLTDKADDYKMSYVTFKGIVIYSEEDPSGDCYTVLLNLVDDENIESKYSIYMKCYKPFDNIPSVQDCITAKGIFIDSSVSEGKVYPMVLCEEINIQ